MPRPMRDARLLTPFQQGGVELSNRVVMAPMSRCRCSEPGGVPDPLVAEHYVQRAGAGLIIAEAAWIVPSGRPHCFAPGIWSEAQIEGWGRVTETVHTQGGRIYLQLHHAGRLSHPVLLDGERPVAPSALCAEGTVHVLDEAGNRVERPCAEPRALGAEEARDLAAEFGRAAQRTVRAGFDGVELQAGHGGLIDQFLRSSSNHRTDAYGGDPLRRLRFLEEAAGAAADAIGAERVGLRMSPHLASRGMACPEILELTLEAARRMQALGLAYLHLSEADMGELPLVEEGFRLALRHAFAGAIMVAGGYGRHRAEAILRAGHADLVAFGRPFIANPDLPHRLAEGLPLADFDPACLFEGGARGYTDYPPFEERC